MSLNLVILPIDIITKFRYNVLTNKRNSNSQGRRKYLKWGKQEYRINAR